MKHLILFLTSLLFFSACSGSPPEIINKDWMVVYTYDQTRGGIYAELDFFLLLKDEDGLNDISEVNLYRDDQGWSWHLTPENWTSFSRDGEDWIGSNGLTRGGDIPGGDYRGEIRDRSGQKSETIFHVEQPRSLPRSYEFPRTQVTSDSIRIDAGSSQPVVIWFYNDKGDLVSEVYKRNGFYRKDELLKPEELQIVKWFMIYHQDEEGGYGLKSGPFLMDPPPG